MESNQTVTDKDRAQKRRRDKKLLTAVSAVMCATHKGNQKGLKELRDYASGIETITDQDIFIAWTTSVISYNHKIDVDLEKKETEDAEKKVSKRPHINNHPSGDICDSIYYDSWRRSYVTRNERGKYLSLETAQITKRLKMRGLSSAKNQFGVSEIDETLVHIEETNDVGYVGALAGYEAGVIKFGNLRALITDGRCLVRSGSGDFPLMRQVFETLFGDNQIDYFYSWLYFAVKSLDDQTHAPGQAIAIAGARGCGKSLCQQLITQILGGRSAKPYQFMAGETSFNSDLFEAEHLMVEDEVASTDIRSRKHFGGYIKSTVANKDQRLHGKGKDAVMLQPLWRLSITCNDDDEALMVLPPFEDGLEDKIMLFKANHANLPMPAGTPSEKAAFWAAMMKELPAFMTYIRTIYEVPDKLKDPRYGVIHYHNRDMLNVLSKMSPEAHLLELVDLYIMGEKLAWHGSASELTKELTASDGAFEARKLLSWSNACGSYLGRLSKNHNSRVSRDRDSSSRKWRIEAKLEE